jgi:chemotaxis family two-component system response regulator Rcp1
MGTVPSYGSVNGPRPLTGEHRFSARSVPESNAQLRRLSVLVVDDNAAEKCQFRLALKWVRLPIPVALNIVDDCASALDALIHGVAPVPSLILLNLDRRGKRCLKALEALKSSAETRSIPVIAWGRPGTGLADAYDSHVNCVVAKPETVEQAELLLTRIVKFWFSTFTLLPAPTR